MNTALTTFFVIAGAFALVVIALALIRGWRAGRSITRILAMDATARDVRRAERAKARRQRRVK